PEAFQCPLDNVTIAACSQRPCDGWHDQHSCSEQQSRGICPSDQAKHAEDQPAKTKHETERDSLSPDTLSACTLQTYVNVETGDAQTERHVCGSGSICPEPLWHTCPRACAGGKAGTWVAVEYVGKQYFKGDTAKNADSAKPATPYAGLSRLCEGLHLNPPYV